MALSKVGEVFIRDIEQDDAPQVMDLIIRRVFQEDVWRLATDNIFRTRGLLTMATTAIATYRLKKSLLFSLVIGFGALPVSYFFYIRYIELYMHLRSACQDLTGSSDTFFGYWTEPKANRCMKVATIGGQLAGVAAVSEISNKSVEMQRVAVVDEFCGRGVGRKLIDALVERCKVKGYDEVIIQVTSVNERAERIYKKYGFKDHVVRHYPWGLLQWTALRLRLALKL